MKVVGLVVDPVAHGHHFAMAIEERDWSCKSERGARPGHNDDLPRLTAVGPFRGKLDANQRSRPNIGQRNPRGTLADLGILRHTETHRDRVDAVAQGQLVVRGVHLDDLALSIRGRSGNANPDVARKHIALVVIQHGVNVNAVTGLQRQLRNLGSAAEYMRTFVKEYSPGT